MNNISPKVGDWSPWGWIEFVEVTEHLPEGIVSVYTSSHGGLWLSPEWVEKLPEKYKPFSGYSQWAEEDNDAYLVAHYLGLFETDAEQVKLREEMMEKYS